MLVRVALGVAMDDSGLPAPRTPRAPRASRAGIDATRLLAALCLAAWTVAAPRSAVASAAPGDAAGVDATAVDSTGAAWLTIPIDLPPGAAGLAPALALRYASDAGDGPQGVGWGLPLGEVRCAARFGVPDYGDCPLYELDGELLLGPDAHGRYHTSVESFRRIRRLPDASGAGFAWEVTETDGTRRLYGATPDSRVAAGGVWGASTARWLLSEVRGVFANNAVTYTYDDLGDAGARYPVTVLYGLGTRRVALFYEPRPDPGVAYPGGVLRESRQRLREIEVTGDGALHQRVVLGYSAAGDYTTHRSRLVSVQRFGADCPRHPGPLAGCSSLPPHEFEYTDADDAGFPVDGNGPWNWAPSETWEEGVYAERYGDVNGDGLVDAILARCIPSPWPCDQPDASYGEDRWTEVYRAVHLNTGNGFDPEPSEPWTSALQSLVFDAPTLRIKSYDSERQGTRAWTCHVERGSYRSGVFFNDRGETADDLDANYLSVAFDTDGLKIKEVAADTRWRVVDLDGDGRVDLIASTRVGGTWQKGARDCWPLAEHVYHEAHERIVFLNTGSGWERAPSLETEIPAFSAMEISDWFAVFCDNWGWWGIPAVAALAEDEVCRQMVDFPAQFVELNGDGRLDLLATHPEDPRYNPFSGDDGLPAGGDAALAAGCDQYDFCENPMVTRAWVQEETAAGDHAWVRAPEFDLVDPVDGDPLHAVHVEHYPFFDMEYLHDTGAATFMGWDDGVRLVDLNADGLTDVIWSDPIAAAGAPAAHPNGPSEPAGVLLNTGSGWCPVVPGSACAGAAALLPPVLLAGIAEQNTHPNFSALWNTIWHYTLRDETGDGLPDLRRFGGDPSPTEPSDPYPYLSSLGYWPGSDGGSPAPSPAFHVFSPGADATSWADRSWGPHRTIHDYAQTPDLDGDGLEDRLGYDGVRYFSIVAHPDLLRVIRNGRGGEITLSYAAEAEQQDAALELLADLHAPDDAGAPRLTRRPVVESVTVDGPAQEPATTRYAYARGRWSPRLRSGLGFGLVRSTRPDGSWVDSHYHQTHGLAGRLHRRTVWEEVPGEDARALHHVEETWELVEPAAVAGSWPGDGSGEIAGEPARIGRLASRSRSHEYGASPGEARGALLRQEFGYDDAYGFNFVERITTVRPTGTVVERFAPVAIDEERWIAGLVASRSSRKEGRREFSGSSREYTPEGLPRRERVVRSRIDEGVMKLEWDYHRFGYDDFGNLVRRVDPEGRVTEFCWDTPERPAWCPGTPWPSTAGLLLARRDPGVGGLPGAITAFAPDPVFGAATETVSGYGDVPGRRVELDAFGRVARRWGVTTEGEEVLLSDVHHADHAGPPFAREVRYAAPGEAEADAIWTYTVDDGFGGVWKTIRDAGPPDDRRHVAVVTYRFPGARRVRTTYAVACADPAGSSLETDPPCEDVAGASETAATRTTTDAVGRVVLVATPRGITRLRHLPSDEEVVVDPASTAWERVDATLVEDANGHLVRRSFDGERLVAVEECAAGSSFAQGSCGRAGEPNRTLYGYHGNGRLEIVYDAFAVEGASWTDPRHHLRYHFDGVGNVTRVDDPDAGVSVSDYDGAGNLVRSVNARDQERVHVYDALDRLVRIDAPAGEPDYTLAYSPGALQPVGETGPGYTAELGYDGLGRLATERRSFAGGSLHTASELDLLGRPTSVRHAGLGNPIVYEYAGAFLVRVCKNECDEAGSLDILTEVAYDALGRRVRAELPGGTRTWTYSEGAAADERHLTADAFAGPQDFTALHYGAHDGLGNVTQWAVDSPEPEIDAHGTYAYDERSRLVAWERNGLVSGTYDYGYDALGNRTLHEGAVQAFTGPQPHAVAERPGAVYTHDASGNLAAIDREGPADDRYFEFDSANRLACVSSTPAESCDVLRIFYDARGARIREVAGDVTRRFLGEEQVRTHRPEGTVQRADIFAFGERIAYQEKVPSQWAGGAPVSVFGRALPPWVLGLLPLAGLVLAVGAIARGGVVAGVARRPLRAAIAGSTTATLLIVPVPGTAAGGGDPNAYRWILSDRLGSAVTEVDRGGEIVRQVRFKPFGGLDGTYEADVGPVVPRRTYAGHPRQEETDLFYMKARWMDPETGTFLSVDPLVPDAWDPQSFNAYAYAANDPLNLVDPDGKCWRAGVAGCGTVEFAVDLQYGATGAAGDPGAGGTVFPSGSAAGHAPHEGPVRGSAGEDRGLRSRIGAVFDGIGKALQRVATILAWDLALAFSGLVGNLYGIVAGVATAILGIAFLSPSMIWSGLTQIGWALVPRYGWWSGPGWGLPNLESAGSWPGPYSDQNVIEDATYRHDRDAGEPGADRALIRDVWSRHDLGPVGQTYRVGMTALFGARIGLGFDG